MSVKCRTCHGPHFTSKCPGVTAPPAPPPPPPPPPSLSLHEATAEVKALRKRGDANGVRRIVDQTMQTMQVDGWFFAEAVKAFLTLWCKDDLRKLWSRAKQYTAQHPSNPPILTVRNCNTFLHAFLTFGYDDGLQE
eukprot:EG_transcript_45716